MTSTILSTARKAIPAELIEKLAGHLGFEKTAVTAAIDALLPRLLSGVATAAEAPGGGDRLANLLAKSTPEMLAAARGFIADPGKDAEAKLSSGPLSSLLGSAVTTAISDAVAKAANVAPESGLKLVNVVGPLVLGELAKIQASDGTDGLVAALKTQARDWTMAPQPTAETTPTAKPETSTPTVVTKPMEAAALPKKPEVLATYEKKPAATATPDVKPDIKPDAKPDVKAAEKRDAKVDVKPTAAKPGERRATPDAAAKKDLSDIIPAEGRRRRSRAMGWTTAGLLLIGGAAAGAWWYQDWLSKTAQVEYAERTRQQEEARAAEVRANEAREKARQAEDAARLRAEHAAREQAAAKARADAEQAAKARAEQEARLAEAARATPPPAPPTPAPPPVVAAPLAPPVARPAPPAPVVAPQAPPTPTPPPPAPTQAAPTPVAPTPVAPPPPRATTAAVATAPAPSAARPVATAPPQRADCLDAVIRATNSGAIRFDTAQAVLAGDSAATLDRIAAAMKACPSSALRIEGHTDNQGDPDRNQLLSETRARAVAEHLQAAGVARARLSPLGYGETKPLAPNNSTENKARNRRISFGVDAG